MDPEGAGVSVREGWNRSRREGGQGGQGWAWTEQPWAGAAGQGVATAGGRGEARRGQSDVGEQSALRLRGAPVRGQSGDQERKTKLTLILNLG